MKIAKIILLLGLISCVLNDNVPFANLTIGKTLILGAAKCAFYSVNANYRRVDINMGKIPPKVNASVMITNKKIDAICEDSILKTCPADAKFCSSKKSLGYTPNIYLKIGREFIASDNGQNQTIFDNIGYCIPKAYIYIMLDNSTANETYGELSASFSAGKDKQYLKKLNEKEPCYSGDPLSKNEKCGALDIQKCKSQKKTECLTDCMWMNCIYRNSPLEANQTTELCVETTYLKVNDARCQLIKGTLPHLPANDPRL